MSSVFLRFCFFFIFIHHKTFFYNQFFVLHRYISGCWTLRTTGASGVACRIRDTPPIRKNAGRSQAFSPSEGNGPRGSVGIAPSIYGGAPFRVYAIRPASRTRETFLILIVRIPVERERSVRRLPLPRSTGSAARAGGRVHQVSTTRPRSGSRRPAPEAQYTRFFKIS